MAAAVVIVSAVAGAVALHAERKASNAQAASAPSVVSSAATVAEAKQARWPVVLQAMGAIAPWQEALISAQVSGLRLIEIRADVGDQVRRGQVLARYDREALEIERSRLQAQWQQAETTRSRALQLDGTGGISEQDMLQYVTQADVAKAQLRSVELQIRQADVLAPDDGVISARSAKLGAVASVGQELFRLIRKGRLEWRGELTASQLAQVRIGQRVRLALPDGHSATATVRRMAPALDTQSRLGVALADIEGGTHARAGMYVQGVLELAESPAVVVPAGAVVIRDGRSYVMTLTDEDRVIERRVEIGRRRSTLTEILSGLRPGERLISQGAGLFYTGDLVRVVPANADSAPKMNQP